MCQQEGGEGAVLGNESLKKWEVDVGVQGEPLASAAENIEPGGFCAGTQQGCLGILGSHLGLGGCGASWKKEQVSNHLYHTCDSCLPAAGHS